MSAWVIEPLDLMIDIETLGKHAGCQVLSIGVAAFEPDTGHIVASQQWNLTLDDQLEVGLVVCPDTVAWWEGQDNEVYDAQRTNPVPAPYVIGALRGFISEYDTDRVWAQGNMDVPVVEAMVRAFELDITLWDFWRVRDTRTAYDEHGFNAKSVPRTAGAAHGAVSDAIHQVKCLTEARKHGRRGWLARLWHNFMRGHPNG